MAANLQVISGRLRPNVREGNLRIDFGTPGGDPNGNASLVELRGEGRDFRSTPHAIISLSDTTLSTFDNSFYKVDRTMTAERITITWKINAAPGAIEGTRRFGEIDFLVIGERG
jgi:hypothetical protein